MHEITRIRDCIFWKWRNNEAFVLFIVSQCLIKSLVIIEAAVYFVGSVPLVSWQRWHRLDRIVGDSFRKHALLVDSVPDDPWIQYPFCRSHRLKITLVVYLFLLLIVINVFLRYFNFGFLLFINFVCVFFALLSNLPPLTTVFASSSRIRGRTLERIDRDSAPDCLDY